MAKPEDQFERFLFDASFGGIPIDIKETSDSAGRALARHVYPHRDGADLDDMGAEPRRTECQVIFFARSPDDDFRQRFANFLARVHEGTAQVFVHPLTGQYRARAGALTFAAAAEPRDTIVVAVTFEEDTTEPQVFSPGAGTPALAGLEEVRARAAQLADALASVSEETGESLSSSVGDTSVTVVESWQVADNRKTVREINLELVGLSNEIERENGRLEVETDVAHYPILLALSDLNYSVRMAAETVIAASPRIIEVTVAAPTPLLVLAARLYGAGEAEDREEELLRLNDIRNPARLDAGTVLKASAPSSSRSPR